MTTSETDTKLKTEHNILSITECVIPTCAIFNKEGIFHQSRVLIWALVEVLLINEHNNCVGGNKQVIGMVSTLDENGMKLVTEISGFSGYSCDIAETSKIINR